MMTAQEIVDDEGFIILGSRRALSLGAVEPFCDSDWPEFIPHGTKVVIVGEVTREEADAHWMRICGERTESWWPYFYKVIAE